jgi:hypothetical protein
VDHPLGHTAGRPGDVENQHAIARAAVALFDEITESGTIVPIESDWGTPWRDEARELRDHRSPRHDVPQYQAEADRDAAVTRHGEAVACAVCAPADVPAD